jgi:hypothetical protein
MINAKVIHSGNNCQTQLSVVLLLSLAATPNVGTLIPQNANPATTFRNTLKTIIDKLIVVAYNY